MTPQELQQLRALVEKFIKSDRYLFEKHLQLADGKNIQLGRTTGTKIGLSTSEKVGFFGTTPRVQYTFAQPFTAADIGTMLESFGLGTH